MSNDLNLRCACGSIHGKISAVTPKNVNRLICHCDDCQAFVKYLGQQKQVLDEHGGTEICQTSVGKITLEKGHDNISALRLSPKGILRWYATCCDAPICNTLASPGIPFVGVVGARLSPKDPTVSMDQAVGPVNGRVHIKYASGDMAAIKNEEVSLVGQGLRMMINMAKARLGGDHKRTPFFDALGSPIVEPKLISLEEKTRLYQS